MCVFSSVGDFFYHLWTNVLVPDLLKAKAIAVAFFSAAAEDAAKQLGEAGLRIITNAVMTAEQTGGTGKDKFAAAQARIATDLTKLGINAAQHVVNAAIEAAVSQMNTATKPVAVVEPVSAGV
jgi:Pyruvate/2-oxoacid:ferredoxin oxidoreductase gamma subunit